MKHRFPPWIKKRIPQASTVYTREILRNLKLNTVCESALCPNISECYSRRRASFLILGNICTRSCNFCGLNSGVPEAPYSEEPYQIAQASLKLGLKHIVITSVTRDDLADGGASQFVETIRQIKKLLPHSTVEVLTPDFQGREESIFKICQAQPDIYNHNLETVPRLYLPVRPQAIYERSLNLLQKVKENFPQIKTKSGLMVGLGETPKEVIETLKDLREKGCEIVTIGQYLRPQEGRLAVEEFVEPETFTFYENQARQIGFSQVCVGPFVRSSYYVAPV